MKASNLSCSAREGLLHALFYQHDADKEDSSCCRKPVSGLAWQLPGSLNFKR